MPLNQQKKRYVSVTIRLSIRKQQQQIKLNWTLQQVFDKLGLSETTNSRVESLKKLPFSPTEKKDLYNKFDLLETTKTHQQARTNKKPIKSAKKVISVNSIKNQIRQLKKNKSNCECSTILKV